MKRNQRLNLIIMIYYNNYDLISHNYHLLSQKYEKDLKVMTYYLTITRRDLKMMIYNLKIMRIYLKIMT